MANIADFIAKNVRFYVSNFSIIKKTHIADNRLTLVAGFIPATRPHAIRACKVTNVRFFNVPQNILHNVFKPYRDVFMCWKDLFFRLRYSKL